VKFSKKDHKPMGSFDLIEPGDYRAIIIDADWKDNAAKTGKYLKIQFELTDSTVQGRYLWSILNLKHTNETAVGIACSEMVSIQDAIGVDIVFETDKDDEMHALGQALLHKRLLVTVGVEKRKDTGEMQNRIKAYAGLESGSKAAGKFTPTGDDDLPF